MSVAIEGDAKYFVRMDTTVEKPTKAAAKRAAALEAAQRSGKDWQKVFGWAAGDPLHDEAVKLGAEYRMSQNQQTTGHAHP